uniref:TLC domain-containing protein n=2 Tax=Craspedostauros australis TaxID=1486917 RepID=A0A7R9ZS59_9STRA|mmetsp:Transcript_8088/g.21891  ORF Transcript_8088/g.21891 Transcript_8088/m.21891 type:complete len:290 (+) Transcript_8088:231-1100(+)|eukprot:CAMPEP_0198115054 /NCGR_PEP_ID=MMETSP1442-20131203/6253_1 /TAXON_ID= /ORGANISM="Craspedostauros australis, Strain CCMP3328" /LENGTH=289 /DNA_ID=CAMNT_0043772481 /DNA_START=181 /DNA_END=1050 /DNA_ORIENTATION=-
MTSTKQVQSWDPSEVDDIFSSTMLRGIQALDAMGAQEWNLAAVAVATAVLLLGVRMALGKKLGVDWLALLHAIVSGYGSFVCTYLSFAQGQALTGTAEPMRSLLCQGALTSMHRFIPAVTMGYGLFDIAEGLSHGVDFLAHGLATFSIMAYFCYYDVSEIIVPMLLMEISTCHLAAVRAEFFSELITTVNMGFFVLAFFAYRIVSVPYIWYGIVSTISQVKDTEEYQSCLPSHFHIMVFVFGVFFHSLNAFWFYKIILKVKRKLSGNEKIKEGNELEDAGQKIQGKKED